MNKIAFQGELGANSHIACREVYPDLEPLPCATFEDAAPAALPHPIERATLAGDRYAASHGSFSALVREHFGRDDGSV